MNNLRNSKCILTERSVIESLRLISQDEVVYACCKTTSTASKYLLYTLACALKP
ncbi:hypothetical protein CANCADRAFT_32044 [Tortispora caseinolytica NRRL Y-17796]|uniref:Uncharacterized protein n=1 Tax=Tortispora caseinolytica NRRL Y-17796 TaxID=767744 RepID=A0A1E4TI10_9ASCO|nr:hypothetical protein CANCADRAFT_32044 [Tortispora caseinolytica NRRL Y-17796]